MIARILSALFPPALPDPVTDWEPPPNGEPIEHGWCGNVRRKPYRDGIERHFAEKAQSMYFGTHSQYMTQLRNAEAAMLANIREMEAQGYRLHDE